MSAVLGVFSRDGGPVDPALVARLLEPMRGMGEHRDVFSPAPGACLAVLRHDWEGAAGLAGPAEVVCRGALAVAADASLYYRGDLERRLAARRVVVDGPRAAHAVAAAFEAWGERCPERLEGDFAFVAYDRTRECVFFARDFTGRRPLFYANLGGTLVVASRVAAILAHPDCPRDLRPAVLGAAAANLSWSLGADTAWAAVEVVPMAGSACWCAGELRCWRHWLPADVPDAPARPFAAAAGELRESLAAAVLERLAPDAPTAVWMSGGRDSTAVFGAGQHGLRGASGSRALRPVSISYPPGDWGREDEAIEAVARFWEVPIHWLDIAAIPMFDRDAERAAARDEPTTSPYELWNLALAEGTLACGARVGLDGNGGDQLFMGTDVYLSELLRSGRWLRLARALRDRRHIGWRYLLQATVEPALPSRLTRLAHRLRTGSPGRRHYLENAIPPWIRRDFVAREGLLERERAHLPEAAGGSRAQAELHWTLTVPIVGYMQGFLQQLLSGTGVEMRSPLLDRRVVELALRRPPFERFLGVEKKGLLRAAMEGLLPREVLRVRPLRTGTTLSYSKRSMRADLAGLCRRLTASPLRLAELGIVDERALARAVVAYEAGDDRPRIAVFHTLQAELWARAHVFDKSDI